MSEEGVVADGAEGGTVSDQNGSVASNFGLELWDQYDEMVKYADQGVDYIKKYSQFVKDRIELENRKDALPSSLDTSMVWCQNIAMRILDNCPVFGGTSHFFRHTLSRENVPKG